ncbi:MAG: ATPase [Saprospirales bacterium]|nr:ATPase [Saprospirales bacterium]
MSQLTFVCVSCEFKGVDFLKACKACGNKVYLITTKDTETDPWPWDSIDEVFYMDEVRHGQWNMEHFIAGMAWLMRTEKVDRIVALDDFDVEEVAELREHFRIPGMGQTTARHFRDKLAMRMQAADKGLDVPAFTALFNDAEINAFADSVKPPYMVKPRFEAAAKGIKKVHSKDELWKAINDLGEARHMYLAEAFKPGDIYHVDSLTYEGKQVFTRVSQYLSTPWEVAHGGGIFRSVICEENGPDDKTLRKFNSEVLEAFGLAYSASHTEFIKCHEDGKFYFLETSSRVGGAHLAEMLEIATGINLWAEWARLEDAVAKKQPYRLPKVKKDYAGIITSLARQQHPDYGVFNDPEVAWTMDKDYHVSVIVKSPKRERVLELLDKYAHIIKEQFHAVLPMD